MQALQSKFLSIPKSIILGSITIAILLIFLSSWLSKRMASLSKIFIYPRDAQQEFTKSSNKLVKHKPNTGLNWTLSFWIYIDDLNYRFNKERCYKRSK